MVENERSSLTNGSDYKDDSNGIMDYNIDPIRRIISPLWIVDNSHFFNSDGTQRNYNHFQVCLLHCYSYFKVHLEKEPKVAIANFHREVFHDLEYDTGDKNKVTDKLNEVTVIFHKNEDNKPNGEAKVSELELRMQVYNKESISLTNFIKGLKESNPTITENEINVEVNNRTHARIVNCEAIMAATKLEYQVLYELKNEYLKVCSENERERVRKQDQSYRNKIAGKPTKEVKDKTRKPSSHVPSDPIALMNKNIELLMACGYSREEAIAKSSPKPRPVIEVQDITDIDNE